MKKVFIKTVFHFFHRINEWFRKVKEVRQVGKIKYLIDNLICLGALLFLLKIGSRRQINFKFKKKEFVENLNKIIGKEYLCMGKLG